MALRPSLALALALVPCLIGCSSTPELVLDIQVDPAGAEVFLSRKGEKTYRGDFGPFEGDMRAEPLQEDFSFVGNAPLQYTSVLEERESGGTVMGFGGGVIRKYKEGIVRIEKDGYETVERHVRFVDDEVQLSVKLERAEPESAQP